MCGKGIPFLHKLCGFFIRPKVRKFGLWIDKFIFGELVVVAVWADKGEIVGARCADAEAVKFGAKSEDIRA